MNITIQEKLMFAKAKEIQNIWEPEKGDIWVCGCKYCIERNASINMVNDYDFDALSGRDLTNVESTYSECVRVLGNSFVEHFHECRGMFVWICHEWQLRKMAFTDNEGLQTICAIMDSFSKAKGARFSSGTMRQLLLAFVMEKVYQKEWCVESRMPADIPSGWVNMLHSKA